MRSEVRWQSPDKVALMGLEEASSGNERFDKEVVSEWDSLRPNIKNLRGVISPEKITRDEEYLTEVGENFEKQSLSARRLEYSIMEGVGSYNWFGEEVEVVPSHRYDDVRNGTDMILCFPGKNKLLVDVTTTPSASKLREKILRTADGLHEGYMPHVDYFYRDEKDEKGRVYLPRVIIGTDAEKAEKLFAGFCAMLDRKKELGPEVAKDNFQRELLKQIRRQLVFYLEDTLEALLKYHGREDNSVLTKIRMGLDKVKDIELAEEMESQEFKSLLDSLDKNREAIFQVDPRLASNIFKHLDVLAITGQIEQEKSSQGIEVPGASNPTEEMLEIKKSSFV